jgi:hypothetical protein
MIYTMVMNTSLINQEVFSSMSETVYYEVEIEAMIKKKLMKKLMKLSKGTEWYILVDQTGFQTR